MRFFTMAQTRIVSSYKFRTYMEGEGENPPPAPEPDPNANSNPPTANKKLFTQEEVNNFVKRDKDKSKIERDQLLQQMQTLKEQGLTPENLESLNERIEQLTNEGKTKETLAQEALSKKEKEWNKEHEKTKKDRDFWKGQYDTYRSQTEILTEAAKNKAHNPNQIYQFLKPNTFMVQKMDDAGKPTEEWVPKVKLTVTEDGQPKVLDLTVTEAVKRMTEMEEHSNLFNSGASSGIGGNNNGGTRGNNAIPTDMNSYMAARKKNPNLLRGVGGSN